MTMPHEVIEHKEAIRIVKLLLVLAHDEAGGNEMSALICLMMAAEITKEAFRRLPEGQFRITELEANIEQYAREFIDYGEQEIGTIEEWSKKHGGEE